MRAALATESTIAIHAPDPMLPWIASELLRIREHAGLSLREMQSEVGLNYAAMNRIERGENWPRDVDQIVSAYANVAGISSIELWRRALARWADASSHPEAIALAKRLRR